MPVTIAETREYSSRAEKIFDSLEQNNIIDYLAEYPKAGVVIQGTGGIRKLRWACKGSGKRGGARIIYYYHDERMPLYLLTVFTKNEKADLNLKEARQLASAVKILVKHSLEKSR